MTTDDLIQKEIEEFRKAFGFTLPFEEDMKRAEQFLFSSLHKIKDEAKREAIEKMEEWADNDTGRSIRFFIDYPEAPGIEARQSAVASIKRFLNSLKEDGGK